MRLVGYLIAFVMMCSSVQAIVYNRSAPINSAAPINQAPRNILQSNPARFPVGALTGQSIGGPQIGLYQRPVVKNKIGFKGRLRSPTIKGNYKNLVQGGPAMGIDPSQAMPIFMNPSLAHGAHAHLGASGRGAVGHGH